MVRAISGLCGVGVLWDFYESIISTSFDKQSFGCLIAISGLCGVGVLWDFYESIISTSFDKQSFGCLILTIFMLNMILFSALV